MRFVRFRRLRGKFLVWMLGVLLVTASVPVAFFVRERAAQIDREIRLQETQLAGIGAQIEERFAGYAKDVIILEHLPAIDGLIRARDAEDGVDPVTGITVAAWEEQLEQVFLGYVLARPYLGIRYVDQQGREVVHVRTPQDGDALPGIAALGDISTSTLFQEVREYTHGDVYVADVALRTQDDTVVLPAQPAVMLARTVWANSYPGRDVHELAGHRVEGEESAEFRGAVLLEVDALDFLDLIYPRTRGVGDNLALLNRHGFYLRNPETPQVEFGWQRGMEMEDATSAHFARHIPDVRVAGDRVTTEFEEAHGQGTYFLHRVVHNDPVRSDRFLILVAEISQDVIAGDISERFRTSILLLAAAFSLAYLVAFLFFAQPTARAVMENARAVGRVATGDFSTPIPVSGSDEVGDVARGINDMMEKINTREHQLLATQEAVERHANELERAGASLKNTQRAILNILEDLDQEKRGVEAKVRQRTRELEEEKNKLSIITENIAMGTMLLDAAGTPLFTNKAFDAILSSAHALHPQETLERFSKLFLDANVKEHLARCIAGDPVQIAEALGNNRIFEITFSCLRTKEREEIFGHLILVRDITEDRLLAKAKEEFVAITAHELRTPLTIIRGNAELLLSEAFRGKQAAVAKKQVEAILNGSVRLLGIVNDFLDLTRLESGQMDLTPKSVDLTALVKEVVEALQEKAKAKGVALVFDAPNDLLTNAYIDRDRTKEIVINMTSNAIQYTEKGSVAVGLVRGQGGIEVRVKDTGVGIAPEAQRGLFTKFQTVGDRFMHSKEYGSGMGLYISRLLAEAMGGSVTLEASTPGKGSTFLIVLPVAEGEGVAYNKNRKKKPEA